MISSHSTTAQLRWNKFGLEANTYVGVMHHAGEYFAVFSGIAKKGENYLGLAHESDLKNGVI
jgi:hypothetical protein